MGKKRSRNLSDSDINHIVSILDSWTGPLSWTALVDAVATRVHASYTRQTLHKHERIRNAFLVRKRDIKIAPLSRHRKSEMQKLEERIARLEAQNSRLRSEGDRFLEQFDRWAHNAFTWGMTEKDLNAPLPPTYRGQTKLKLS